MALSDLFPAKHTFRGGQKFWNSPLFTGSPEKHERISTLTPEQQPLLSQAIRAGMNPGAGGAFGASADYYRDLLDNDSQTLAMLSAPEMRQFREQILPNISEQFAGMGSGGLSSSGFQNASTAAGTDLGERLAAIRANLRAQGAAGLQNIGQIGLGNFSQDVMTEPGTPGLLSQFAPAIGMGLGAAIGGPVGASIGSGIGTGTQSWLNSSPKGRSSPYGRRSPLAGMGVQQGNFNSPNFNPMYGMR